MPERILVVDDEPKVLATIKKQLEVAGFEVITAVDGAEAIKLAHSGHPRLMVLDLILPGLSGYHVCKLLKSDERYKAMPIIILTARSEKKDMEEGLKMEADGYITKPCDPDVLVEVIRSTLAKSKWGGAPPKWVR